MALFVNLHEVCQLIYPYIDNMYIERHLLVSLAEVVVLVRAVLGQVLTFLGWLFALSKLYKSSQLGHELYETAQRDRLSSFCHNRSFCMAFRFLKMIIYHGFSQMTNQNTNRLISGQEKWLKEFIITCWKCIVKALLVVTLLQTLFGTKNY